MHGSERFIKHLSTGRDTPFRGRALEHIVLASCIPPRPRWHWANRGTDIVDPQLKYLAVWCATLSNIRTDPRIIPQYLLLSRNRRAMLFSKISSFVVLAGLGASQHVHLLSVQASIPPVDFSGQRTLFNFICNLK